MPQAKATFLLPLADADGRDLAAAHRAVQRAVYDLSDGWTLAGYVEGVYRMADGSQAVDRSAAYVVILEEARLADLERVLRAFRAGTSHEAIYLEIQHGVDFRLLV